MSATGFVEYLDRNVITGWARPAPSSGDLGIVTIKKFGIAMTEVAALDPRKDLARAEIGDGRYGFHYRFPVPLDQAELAAISAQFYGKELKFLENAIRSDGNSAAFLEELNPPLGLGTAITDEAEYPLFLMGVPRSGTSSMLLSILHIGKYKGFGEGHFLSILPRVSATIDKFYDDYARATRVNGVMLNAIEQNALDTAVVSTIKKLAADQLGSKYWVDKTPTIEMITGAHYFKKIWPNARFIFMKRRAVENIQSKIIKFPEISFRDNCDEWADIMKAWAEARKGLTGSYLEIDQADALHKPAQVAREVGVFLNLNSDEVLRFYRALSLIRTEKTAGVAPRQTPVALQDTGWSKEDIDLFKILCGPTMTEFGYTVEEAKPTPPVDKEIEDILLDESLP
jgi:hypothetical protein